MVRPDLHLPPSFLAWLAPFLAAFSRRTRPTAAALAAGALLAVGPRTVANCLRALGLAEHPSANPPGFAGFTAFHRVLNRNAWSGLALARTLLRMTVAAFVPSGPIVIGIDHTLERRRGPCIGPAGRFYDASRRADMPEPTSRGLRWLSAMLLVEVPFAGRIWALPVLTALTPSKAWSERHGRRHRTTTEWARLMLLTLRRCCSALTPSSPFMFTCMPIGSRSRRGGLPGIRNRPRRLPTRSRACASASGLSGSSSRLLGPT